MKSSVIMLAVGAIMGVAAFSSCAHADGLGIELPTLHGDGVCDIVANAAYDGAVEAGDGLPDGAYEQVMGDCDWGGYSALTLNEQIAEDGEVVWPVCHWEGGCK